MHTEALYCYLKEHANQITEEWMNARTPQSVAFYSSSTTEEMERVLRQQHQQTVQLLISCFNPNDTNFHGRLEEWAKTVALSRVENGIAIHVVLKFLQKTRKLCWRFVKGFIAQQDEGLWKIGEMEWSETLNSCFDEMSLSFVEYYHEYHEKRLFEHQELIKLLDIPLIKLYNQVSILPVIGVINSDRGLSMLNEIPMKCNENEVEELILDLSGVIQIEEAVAYQLTQLVQVLNLMGVKCYISGIRPEVAKNTSSFGEEFHRIPKINSIQDRTPSHLINM